MPGTLAIPRVTLPAGTRDFPPAGGFAVDDADTGAMLTIDRTVAGGLNAATPAVNLSIAVWQSGDGGGTWLELSAATAAGGAQQNPPRLGGGTVTEFLMGISLPARAGRLARAHITVTGGSVAVAGSLVIS